MPILGLPLTLLPTILPSIMRFNKLSSRRTCPIQFFFRFTTALARHLSSPIEDSISSFVFLSLQLTFSILLHNHISKAFSLSVTSFFIVHVSQPYSATGHTNVLTILFFSSLFRRFVTSSFIFAESLFCHSNSRFHFFNTCPILCHHCSKIFKRRNLFNFLSIYDNINCSPFLPRYYHCFGLLDIYLHIISLCSFIQAIHHFLESFLRASYHSLIISKSHVLNKFATHSYSFLNSLHRLHHHCLSVYGEQQGR